MATYIKLLGRIGCNRVCAWQIGEVNAVTLVVETAGLCTHSHTTIVTNVLVLVCHSVEHRCLAALRVANQSHIYDIVPLGFYLLEHTVAAALSATTVANSTAGVYRCRGQLLFGLFLG